MAVRLARKFYGTPLNVPFDPDVHSYQDAYTDRYTGERMARSQMEWLVNKGEQLPEDDPRVMTIEVTGHFDYDEDREFRATLCGCTADASPSRFAHDGKQALPACLITERHRLIQVPPPAQTSRSCAVSRPTLATSPWGSSSG